MVDSEIVLYWYYKHGAIVLMFHMYVTEQVSEELERALAKLGPAKLPGRYSNHRYFWSIHAH